MKALTLVTSGLGRPSHDVLIRLEDEDQYPRTSIYAREIESDILDEHYMSSIIGLRRHVYHLLPTYISQVIEAFVIRKRYDIIISWAAQLGLPFAFLQWLTGFHTPHIMLDSWISRPKKAVLLKWLHHGIDRIVLWSTVQRQHAVENLHVPPEKISLVHWFVDQKFFRPMDISPDMICSVGSEMRDYPTLLKAMSGMNIPCHIAAGTLRDKTTPTVKAIFESGPLPPSITVGFKTYPELRSLYARSRFVVVPLHPTDTDNGISTILEAMAMGKAVICTRTKGQVDIVQEGKTGLFVPPRDPEALRRAILLLWNDSDLAMKMGREARRLLEERFTIDDFIVVLKKIVADVVIEKQHVIERSIEMGSKRQMNDLSVQTPS